MALYIFNVLYTAGNKNGKSGVISMFNHEELKVYFRDGIVDFGEATISIANTSFLYGLGVFTGIRAHFNDATRKLYLFRPEDHYKRLREACVLCHYQGFLSSYDYPKFQEILVELLKVNNISQDTYIRVTNFTDENKVTPKFVEYKDSLSAFLYPLGDYVPTTGMRCAVSAWTRVDSNAMPASAKLNGIYVNTAFAKTDALRGGFDEAIFLDANQHVVEGSAENIFIVRGGTLITPSSASNILEGITRDSVMQIARDEGIPVEERSISRAELYRADEVFLTGTGAKVSPVVEIDHRPIADGVPGPISKRIQETYFRAVKGEDDRYARWLVEV